MQMTIESTHLNGLVVLRPEVFEDDRGFFLEAYRKDQFLALGLPGDYVQLNHSRSVKGVVRGLHFQWDPPMGKLMRVTRGAAFLVAVDIRKGSPTLGQWVGMEVSEESKRQIWAPYGLARGFCALTDDCEVQYKCTGIYNPQKESGIHFADPAIGVRWPIDIKTAITSEKDRNAQSLEEWLASPLSEHISYEPKIAAREA